MLEKQLIHKFISILCLIQLAKTQSPEERIAGLEKDVDTLKNQVAYLTNLNEEILKHFGKGETLDDLKSNVPTLEERVEKVEQLAKVGTQRSCEEYADYGIRASGVYTIDPDGLLVGLPPFNVFCNFNVTSGEVTTEVIHSHSEGLNVIDNCEDPGCYVKNVTYASAEDGEIIDPSQLEALIDLSSECKQSFYYECTLAPLRKEDVDYAFWTGRDGKQNVYFTGDGDTSTHACDCHYKEGCIEEELLHNTCNCDSNEPTTLIDTGSITSAALPILTVAFGGLRFDMQQASYTIGRLTCKGKKEFNEASSCQSLKLAGETKSGYYTIKHDANLHTETVFCDFDQGGYENVPEMSQLSPLLPLGTIIPWVKKPNLDSKHSVEDIPEGWQR